MRDAVMQAMPGAAADDRAALALMLAYVEGECRRLGAMAAAEHAALAAAALTEGAITSARPTLAPLH